MYYLKIMFMLVDQLIMIIYLL